MEGAGGPPRANKLVQLIAAGSLGGATRDSACGSGREWLKGLLSDLRKRRHPERVDGLFGVPC